MRLIDKLTEECSENIDRNEMIYNATLGISGAFFMLIGT